MLGLLRLDLHALEARDAQLWPNIASLLLLLFLRQGGKTRLELPKQLISLCLCDTGHLCVFLHMPELVLDLCNLLAEAVALYTEGI